MKPIITIEYCPKCNWLLRAAYMAQEILTTFSDDVYGVTLHPSETAGKYAISINQDVVFDRKEKGRFPDIKELKQLIRDVISLIKALATQIKLISLLLQIMLNKFVCVALCIIIIDAI
jgi:selenoprotein W-related protein